MLDGYAQAEKAVPSRLDRAEADFWGQEHRLTKQLRRKVVHGDDLLYRFFQDVLTKEPELFAKVPQMMLEAMGIWLPLDVYYDWPVLVPWVVRDPKCRGNPTKGIPDEWSSPDRRGYLRDDNSLIKALPRSLSVQTPNAGILQGARMGSEFVASHVWREVLSRQTLASRVPLLNSFVPNLVWLPAQVAKLTDREGSVVQRTLQSMSFAIYHDAPVAPHLEGLVSEAWAMLPEPQSINVSISNLNWFEPTDQFFATRCQRLNTVVAALRLDAGQPLTTKVVTSRYTAGLPGVTRLARRELLAYLRRFQADRIALD